MTGARANVLLCHLAEEEWHLGAEAAALVWQGWLQLLQAHLPGLICHYADFQANGTGKVCWKSGLLFTIYFAGHNSAQRKALKQVLLALAGSDPLPKLCLFVSPSNITVMAS